MEANCLTPWRMPLVIAICTANSKANGSNINTTGVAHTLDLANSNAVFYSSEEVADHASMR